MLLLRLLLMMMISMILMCTDDVMLAYHSLLPMDVHGTLYSSLKLVNHYADDNVPLHSVSTTAAYLPNIVTACIM